MPKHPRPAYNVTEAYTHNHQAVYKIRLFQPAKKQPAGREAGPLTLSGKRNLSDTACLIFILSLRVDVGME